MTKHSHTALRNAAASARGHRPAIVCCASLNANDADKAMTNEYLSRSVFLKQDSILSNNKLENMYMQTLKRENVFKTDGRNNYSGLLVVEKISSVILKKAHSEEQCLQGRRVFGLLKNISLVWMTTAFDPSDGNDAPKRHSHVRREGPLRSFKSFLLGIDDLERVPMEEDLSTATTEASSSPSASPWPALPPALPSEDAGAGEGGGGGGDVRRGRLELRKGCFWGGGFMVRVTVRNGNVTVTAANQRRRQRG